VDTFRTITLPMLKRQFGIEEGLSLQIVRRGTAPGGGGEIHLKLPITKELKLINWTDEGLGLTLVHVSSQCKHILWDTLGASFPPSLLDRGTWGGVTKPA
jgi:RNA 3'-terminal phosphate cyclase-like protein